MKAMVLREFGRRMELEQLPDPVPKSDEVVIRVRACGVCYTDIKVFQGKVAATRLPHILGHEVAGEVVAIGGRVTGVKIGDRCSVYEYIACGECFYCRSGRENQCRLLFARTGLGRIGLDLPGGYAEYVKVPARWLTPVPEGVSFEAAAIAADAMATPFHAIKDNSIFAPGSTALVIGTGGLGLHAIQIAKHLGGRVFAADIDDAKLKLARKLGADHSANPIGDDIPLLIKSWTDGLGCDLVFDFTGKTKTLDLAMKSVRNLGQVVIVGYQYGEDFVHPIQQLISREVFISGCRASTFANQKETLDLVAQGSVVPVIDEIYSLEEANEVLKELQEKGFMGRAVLRP